MTVSPPARYDLTSAGFLSDLPTIANCAGSLLFALAADGLIERRILTVRGTR